YRAARSFPAGRRARLRWQAGRLRKRVLRLQGDCGVTKPQAIVSEVANRLAEHDISPASLLGVRLVRLADVLCRDEVLPNSIQDIPRAGSEFEIEAYIDQLCTVSNKMLNPATPALVEDAVAGAALILSRQLPRQLWAEAVPQGAV